MPSAKQIFRYTNLCDYCARNYECGILTSALTILEKHEALKSDAHCKEQFDNFLKRLEGYGYSYPSSPSFCHLQHDKNMIRDLIYEAIRLNDRFTARISQETESKCDDPADCTTC